MFESRSGKLKIITAVLLLSGSFLFLGNIKNASAYLNSYSKLYNGTLTAAEWNNLASDFLNKSGGATMTGPLGIGTSTPASGLWVNGPIYATNFSGGAFTGFIDASNVMGGSGSSFGSNSGGGNYSFPANLGIGTTNPQFKLDLNLGTVNTNTNIGYNVFADATNNVGYSGYNFQLNNTSGNASGYMRLARTAGTAFLGMEIGSQSVNGIRFLTHATTPVEVVRINAAGFVGIGTTNPQASLDTTGLIKMRTATITQSEDVINKGYLDSALASSSATIITQFSSSSLWNGTSTANIWSANTGNVGVGTTNPSYKLSLGATNDKLGFYSDSTHNASIELYNSANANMNFQMTNGVSGAFTFMGSSAANGNIGVGTTTPAERLEVMGNLLLQNNNNIKFRSSVGTAISVLKYDATNALILDNNNSTAGTIRFKEGGTDRMIINNGKVGIGTIVPAANLEIASSTGATINLNTSDSDVQSGDVLGNLVFTARDDGSADGDDNKGKIRVEATGAYVGGPSDPSKMVFSLANGVGVLTDYITLLSGGNLGIGTAVPNDVLSIGNSGAAPAGSPKTGHNYTSTYLATDDYALANYGLVKTLIGNATSSLVAGNLWNGALNGNIYNGTSGAGNVGIGTTGPLAKLQVAGTSTYNSDTVKAFRVSDGTTITKAVDIGFDTTLDKGFIQAGNFGTAYKDLLLNPNMGNVGIGTTNPEAKLDIRGTNKLIGVGVSQRGNLFVATTDEPDINVGGSIVLGGKYLTGQPNLIPFATIHGKKETAASGNNGGFLAFETANNSVSPYTFERMRITSTGNVGVGTTNPTANLHIDRNVNVPISSLNATNNNSNNYATAASIKMSGTSGSNGLMFGVSGTANDRVSWIQSGHPDTQYVSNVGTLLLNPLGGNIGIGTTAPNDIFSIGNAGSAPAGSPKTGHNFTSTYLATDDYALANYGLVKTLIGNATSSLVAGNLWNGTLNGNIYNGVAGAGNVGIGTNNPGAKLDINGNTLFRGGASIQYADANVDLGSPWMGTGLMIQNTSGTAGTLNQLSFLGNSGFYAGGIVNELTVANGTETKMHFVTRNGGSYGPRMTIDKNGNLGVGTMAPGEALHISKSAPADDVTTFIENTGYTAGANTRLLFSTKGTDGNAYQTSIVNRQAGATAGNLVFQTVGNDRMIIDNAGNVGIGTMNPSYVFNGHGTVLDINGDLRLRTGGLIETTALENNAYYNSGYFRRAAGYAWYLGEGAAAGYVSILTAPTGAVDSSVSWATPFNINMTTGNVGIGTTAPNDIFSIGNAGSAPAGSPKTGHNYTSTYLATDDYALANYGLVKTLIGNATSSLVAGSLWNGTLNGNIWNGASGAGNIGIGTTNPFTKLEIAGALKLGDTADACDANHAGAIRYNSTSDQTYLCDGTRWINQNNCGLMSDDAGQTYGTIQIGGQCWMAENINIGTMLASGATNPTTTDNTIQKWCYNNDPAQCLINGGLYNWDEAMRGSQVSGARGICPGGWHIPSDAEYNKLEKTILGVIASPNGQYACNLTGTGWQRCADNSGTDTGGTYGVGKSLKAIGVGSGVGAGNDLVGFNGKLAGNRNTGGSYYNLGGTLLLWSSTPNGSSYAWFRALTSTYSAVYRGNDARAYGFSVRCLRD